MNVARAYLVRIDKANPEKCVTLEVVIRSLELTQTRGDSHCRGRISELVVPGKGAVTVEELEFMSSSRLEDNLIIGFSNDICLLLREVSAVEWQSTITGEGGLRIRDLHFVCRKPENAGFLNTGLDKILAEKLHVVALPAMPKQEEEDLAGERFDRLLIN